MANREFDDWMPYTEYPLEYVEGNDPTYTYTFGEPVHEIQKGEVFRIWSRIRMKPDGSGADNDVGGIAIVEITGGSDEGYGKHFSKKAFGNDWVPIITDYIRYINALRQEGRI